MLLLLFQFAVINVDINVDVMSLCSLNLGLAHRSNTVSSRPKLFTSWCLALLDANFLTSKSSCSHLIHSIRQFGRTPIFIHLFSLFATLQSGPQIGTFHLKMCTYTWSFLMSLLLFVITNTYFMVLETKNHVQKVQQFSYLLLEMQISLVDSGALSLARISWNNSITIKMSQPRRLNFDNRSLGSEWAIASFQPIREAIHARDQTKVACGYMESAVCLGGLKMEKIDRCTLQGCIKTNTFARPGVGFANRRDWFVL